MFMSRQKFEIFLAKEGSGPAFFSMEIGHIFTSNVGNEFLVMLRRKGPHKTKIAYDILRIHSLMIYAELIEHKIVVDTKAPLLRCFPYVPKHTAADITTTGQYMNYQTFSKLQFRPLLKNCFHSFQFS